MAMIYRLLQAKLYPPKDTNPDFSGRSVVVTGANTGLGFEAAIKFVNLGAAKVILAVRSLDKGNEAKTKLESRTGRVGIVEVWALDMLDYDSIYAFADRVSKEIDRLDIAVLNAGIAKVKYEQSKYGWETTLQVNVISTTLLALLLLPKLKASKTADWTPVLEIIGSGTSEHVTLKPEVDDLSAGPLEAYNSPDTFSGMAQYSYSKLLLLYAIPYLCKLAESKNGRPEAYVTVVGPGATVSDIGRDATGIAFSAVKTLMNILARSTEEGARAYISGITLGEKGHGRFWQNDLIQP